MSEPPDLERTQSALARTLRAYSATLTAYAELVGMDGEDDDELVYENVRTRIAEVVRLRAELARRDEQIAAVRKRSPSRLAEIRAYIQRLDLNQLPGWTIEQRIIADLFEAVEAVRDLHIPWSHKGSAVMCETCTTDDGKYQPWPCPTVVALGDEPPANPYRDGEQQ